MGIVRGLANINKQLDNGGNGDRIKVPFFKLADGKATKVRFLQEFDTESPNYNEQAGLGFLAVEHQSPKDFKKRAMCTADEGECYGCEQYSSGVKEFRPKSKLYINVLVDTVDDDGMPVKKVQVLSQGNGGKSVTPALLEAAGEFGSVTNRQFKIKRTGAGVSDTSYTLTPLDKDDDKYDVTQHEMFDLEKVVYNIPYADQKAYYDADGFATKAPASVGAAASSDSEVW